MKPKNTGVGGLSLFQQIFLTQELNQGLLPCRWILYQLSYQGSPFTNWAIREARMVAPRKRKSSKNYPRKVRMDIFLVRHNLQRYFPTHPPEPYKIKNKPTTTKMGQTGLFVCLEGESNVKRNWKQGNEARWIIHQNCRGRARGKGSHIPTAIKIYFTDRITSLCPKLLPLQATLNWINLVHNFVLVFIVPISGIAESKPIFQILLDITKLPAKGMVAICFLTSCVV